MVPMNPHSCAYPPETRTHTFHTHLYRKRIRKKIPNLQAATWKKGPTSTPSTAVFFYREPKAHSGHVDYTLGVTDLGTACPRSLSHIWGLHGLLPISIFLLASQTSAHPWGEEDERFCRRSVVRAIVRAPSCKSPVCTQSPCQGAKRQSPRRRKAAKNQSM